MNVLELIEELQKIDRPETRDVFTVHWYHPKGKSDRKLIREVLGTGRNPHQDLLPINEDSIVLYVSEKEVTGVADFPPRYNVGSD